MALQRDPVTFGRLKALSMRKRMEIAQAPDVAMGLLSSLTPTDLALLFPTYYKKILPDVSGFRAAISKQSSEQQAAAQGSLLQRLSAVEATAAVTSRGSISRPWAERASSVKMPAQLTPEQVTAWNKLQQGALSANSSEGKLFGKLSASQLASIGVTRTKDNTGAEVYQYQQPQITKEEAVNRLKSSGGSGSLKQNQGIAYQTLISEGLSPSAARAMVANMSGESLRDPTSFHDDSPKSRPGTSNAHGIVQWNTERANFIKDHWPGANGRLPHQMSVAEQTRAAVWEMKTRYTGVWNRLNDPNSSESDKVAMLVYDYEIPADKGTAIRNRLNFLNQGIGTEGVAEKPRGSNGEYSEEQINKMMEQLRTEKNEQRRQELATIIGSAGGSSSQDAMAAVTGKVTYGQVKDFSQYILHSEPGHKQCGQGARILAGHMYGHGAFLSDGLGVGGSPNAGSLSQGNNYFQRSGLFHQPKHISEDSVKNQAYLDSLPIGTVVSATKSGGAGHVQVKIGPGQWASDFKQQHFISNGYSNFAVHMPNDAGLEALKKNGVDQSITSLAGDEKVVNVAPLRMTQRPGEAPEPPPPPPPATPSSYNPESGDDGRPDLGGDITASVDKKEEGYQQPQEQLNPQAVRDIQAQQGTMPPGPATPKQEIPKVSSGSYKLNMKAFREAVKNDPSNTYPGWMIDMASDQDIIDGFNKDARVKAAGVNIADGKLTVKDMSNPEVKAVIEGAQKSGALKAIEQAKPKVEAPKEAPKPVPEPTKPTATVEQRTSRPGEAPEPTPPPPPEPAPKPVKGYSDGGSFNAPDSLNFYKVDKQDDIVAINPQTQKPIATMQSGETLSRGDGRVDVTPQSKSNDAGPVPDTNVTQLSNIMSSFSDALSNIGKNTQTTPKVSQETVTNHPNLIGDTNRQIVNQQKFSPSYDRAMHRISKGTEPSGSYDHFSYGNK